MYNSFIGFIGLHFENKVGYKSRELFPKQCMGGYNLWYTEYAYITFVARIRSVWDKGLHDMRVNMYMYPNLCKLVQNNVFAYLSLAQTDNLKILLLAFTFTSTLKASSHNKW